MRVPVPWRRFPVGYNLEETLSGQKIIYNTIKNTSSLTITLSKAVSTLDEMQVIAYGTTTRRLSTGNITSVKAADIEKQPVNNPLLALQGRVPGVFITQRTGLPG